MLIWQQSGCKWILTYWPSCAKTIWSGEGGGVRDNWMEPLLELGNWFMWKPARSITSAPEPWLHNDQLHGSGFRPRVDPAMIIILSVGQWWLYAKLWFRPELKRIEKVWDRASLDLGWVSTYLCSLYVVNHGVWLKYATGQSQLFQICLSWIELTQGKIK